MSPSPESAPAPTARSPAAIAVLQSERHVGLSEDDAQTRLAKDGPNELPTQQDRALLTLILEVPREPMFLMPIAGGAVHLLLSAPADELVRPSPSPICATSLRPSVSRSSART